MNKLKIIIVSAFALVGALTFVPNVAMAACTSTSSAADCLQDGADKAVDNNTCKNAKGAIVACPTLPERAKTITNTLLFILGAIAVIMIIIGGIRYVVSGGDSTSITGAKNTILYAVIGLVVAILAYAIVNFVLTTLK